MKLGGGVQQRKMAQNAHWVRASWPGASLRASLRLLEIVAGDFIEGICWRTFSTTCWRCGQSYPPLLARCGETFGSMPWLRK
jgi:hypothetical protein